MHACRFVVRFSALLCPLLFFRQGLAQTPERSPEEYLEKLFEARIGELPRMGWFVPTHGFLAQERAAEEINLFAPIGAPLIGRKKGAVAETELKEFRKTYGIACEIQDADQLTAYDLGAEVDSERALYTVKRWPGDVSTGLLTVPIDGIQMAKVNQLLGWPSHGTLRRDEAIGARPQSFFYSRHKLYDQRTALLKEEAIILHRKDGGYVAHELTRKLVWISPVMDARFQATCIPAVMSVKYV